MSFRQAAFGFGRPPESKIGALLKVPLLLPADKEMGTFSFGTDFGGALLSVCLDAGDGYVHACGTACLIAPGVALCADHVVPTDFQGTVYCLGKAGSDLRLWKVSNTMAQAREYYDGLLLLLEPLFDLGPHWKHVQFQGTCRIPQIGERVSAYGLIGGSYETHPIADVLVELDTVVAHGTVLEFLPNGQPGRWMGGPVLRCTFDGPSGMSGGPIFDENGHVFGVLSRSMELEDHTYDSYVSVAYPLYLLHFEPAWPQPAMFHTLWPEQVHDHGLLHVEEMSGRLNVVNSSDPL